MEIIKYIIGSIFLLMGMVIFAIEIFGIFKMKTVLNRMHSAALGDTMGISCSMLGLMIMSGVNYNTLKMALVILFLWFTSPVASHLLANLELTTNNAIGSIATVYDDIKDLERELVESGEVRDLSSAEEKNAEEMEEIL